MLAKACNGSAVQYTPYFSAMSYGFAIRRRTDAVLACRASRRRTGRYGAMGTGKCKRLTSDLAHLQSTETRCAQTFQLTSEGYVPVVASLYVESAAAFESSLKRKKELAWRAKVILAREVP